MYALMHQQGGTGESDWVYAEWEGGYGETGEVYNPVIHRTEEGAERALPAVQEGCDYGVSVRRIDHGSVFQVVKD